MSLAPTVAKNLPDSTKNPRLVMLLLVWGAPARDFLFITAAAKFVNNNIFYGLFGNWKQRQRILIVNSKQLTTGS